MPAGKILVVDDEQVIRELFTKVLGKEGYEIVTAKDGDETLKVFRKGSFNLVMMGIKLPGADGVKLLKQLKEIDPDIEGMIITGYASLESAIESLKNGASEYITKPFDKIESVVKVINRLVEKQKLTVENKRLQEETQRQRDELKKRVFELGVLYDVSNAIGYTLDYKHLFKLIMASLSKVVDYDVCTSFLFTEKGGDLAIKSTRAVARDFIKEVEKNVIETFNSLTERRIEEKDISVDLRDILRPAKGEKALTKVKSFFNIPLIVKDKTIGILNVSSSRKNAFGPADIRILYTLSNQAATAISKLRGVIATEKSKMEAMVESMAEGVIMTDERGELVVLNPTARRMLGFKSDEDVTSKKLVGVFGGDTEKAKLLARGISFAAEEEEVHTAITLSTSQPPKILNASQGLVRGEKEEKLGYVTVLRDITKEKEIDRMKTEFVSTVSHELRTPLTSMKNVVSNVLAGVTGEVTEKLKRYLLMMNEDISRLGRLISNLLNISRIESGRLELKKSLVDIDALAKKVISILKLQADEKKIKLKVTSPPNLEDIYLDPDRISEVFTNLIGNAIKFTPEGGDITVTIDDKDKELQCSVSDTGIGIPEDRFDMVFDKFRQVGRVDGPGSKGTGLGLAITKELIGMHQGRIWVESKLGKGSKFIFTLPRTDTEIIFREYLNNGIVQAKKHGVPMSLIVIALANFEQMKEEYKAKGIVKVLKETGIVVNEAISKPVNLINRYHRGEIVAVLPEVSKRELLAAEKRLKKSIKSHQFILNGKPIKMGVTFGIATYPEEAQTEDELIKKVETSLEESKTYQPRIMVVDDEEELCKGLKIRLEANNYQVVTSSNGKEAVEELSKGYYPDLIVLDLLMPIMDGYELYMLLKEEKETRDIPILILTAKGERADKKLGIEFSPYNYITKPFEPRQLLATIKRMLEE